MFEKILYETNDFKIIEANETECITKAADLCSKEFSNCPFFAGLGIKPNDIYTIALEAAKISMEEKLFHCVKDKFTGEIVTISIGLSHKGKHIFEKNIEETKQEFDVGMFFDLTAQVELKEMDTADSVYLFLFATKSSYRNKNLGSCIVKIVLKDLKEKGFKVAYGETVNKKAEHIIEKNGAKLYTTINYNDYKYNGKILSIIDKEERQTSFAFKLESIE